MTDQREEAISFIKNNGPVLPVQISKYVNTNILFASAILSELVSRKMLKITSASIGGSPLYYLTGQEALMDARLSTSLGGREKEAYQLLKENKVLREVDLEPWQRVAVKSLKDFAVQINVNDRGNAESFWKHILVTDEEAKLIISEIMNQVYNQQEIESKLVNVPVQEIYKQPETQPVVEQTETFVQTQFKPIPNQVQPEHFEIEEPKEKYLEEDNEAKIIYQPEEEKIITKPKIKIEKKVDTKFYHNVLAFMKKNEVEVLKEETIKKDKEVDFIVNLPSGFGKLRYLIKAKNKALINEADVSMAFSEGQIRKIPVILLTNGKLNKKASLLIEQKMAGQLTLKEI